MATAATLLLDEARRFADDALAPTAEQIDRAVAMPADRFSRLSDLGLFGVAGPTDLGFGGLDVHELRQLMATIAGGCGATFFCWAQHHGVVRTLTGAANEQLRDEWLASLCRGEVLAGTAFAHVRRADRRAVSARRVEGGWEFDGVAPWATSWGVASVFSIAGESDRGELVWALIDGVDRPGLEVGVLDLPVFGATGTVAMRFERLVVPDDRVISVEDVAAWRHSDRLRAAAGQTGVLGVADRAIRLLADEARSADDPAVAAASRLHAELSDIWIRDREVVDGLSRLGGDRSIEDAIASASDHRAACLDLGRRATTALLAARGGSAMDLGHPAQRLAREAAFYVIQAQTADGRAATLRSL